MLKKSPAGIRSSLERTRPNIHLFKIEAPEVACKAEAGQFVIVRVDEKGERIPLFIADRDREVVTGAATVISAMGVGKRAAASSDAYLMGLEDCSGDGDC